MQSGVSAPDSTPLCPTTNTLDDSPSSSSELPLPLSLSFLTTDASRSEKPYSTAAAVKATTENASNLVESTRRDRQLPRDLPLALEHTSALLKQLVRQRRRVVFFLDYDGTLSPIVDNPDEATIPTKTRAALTAVASRFTTAIVTGRCKSKVMDMVRLADVIYAASHGFDIHGPHARIAHCVAREFIPVMKQAMRDLHALEVSYSGIRVEDNLLSITLHYRHVAREHYGAVTEAVDAVAQRHGLRRHDGKMVHELRPPQDWHKGKAVQYLLETLRLRDEDVVPVYIGDDVADETAFAALRGIGVSVIVAEEDTARGTEADLRLRDPVQVGEFLMRFACDEGLRASTVHANSVGV